jgi:hypothetical protein
LNIRWNLNVVPCCYFNGYEFSFGNLREASVDQIFSSEIFQNFYKKHWEIRLEGIPVCNICTQYRSFSSQEEYMRFAVHQGAQLAGKEVYFWGAGEAYRAYAIFFAQTRPRAMLLDVAGDLPEQIDNIPVLHPEAALSGRDKLPLIIFAYPKHSVRILQTLAEKFPHYSLKDIILCPADSGFLQNENPACVASL